MQNIFLKNHILEVFMSVYFLFVCVCMFVLDERRKQLDGFMYSFCMTKGSQVPHPTLCSLGRGT